MNCSACGVEIQADEQQCSKCREVESKVQVLTLEEKQHFSGITLEQDQLGERRHYNDQTRNANQQMYTGHFSISSTSLITKLLLGIIFATVVFVALPIAILFISIIGIIAFIVRK